MAKKNANDKKKLTQEIIRSNELRVNVDDTGKPSLSIPKPGSNNFSYYTTSDTLTKILESERIYINSASNMNDKAEKDHLSVDAEKTFLFCLCQSDTEKIPMWYLYSGIFGDGAKLRFTKGNLQKLISSIKELEVIPPFNKPDNANDDATPKTIKIGDDFDLTCGWVFYKKEQDNGKCECKYKNNFYTYQPDEFKGIPFVKNYPWEYEKEFRIVIKVKNENVHENNRLAIKISSILGKLDFMFGPEISQQSKKNFYLSAGFENYLKANISKRIAL